jgi:hypothetical protein
LNEVAAREFEAAAARHSDGVADFVASAANRTAVAVNVEQINEFCRNRVLFYITQVNGSAESFQNDFRDEYVAIHGPTSWKTQTQEQVEKDGRYRGWRDIAWNLGDAPAILQSVEYRVLMYYRLIRNHAAHGKKQKSSKLVECESQLADLREAVIEQYEVQRPKKRFLLSSPNPIEQVNFDDLILFSRTVKSMARIVSETARPSDELLLQSLLESRDEQLLSFNESKKKDPPQKWQSRLITLLRERYGLNEDESKAIIQFKYGLLV